VFAFHTSAVLLLTAMYVSVPGSVAARCGFEGGADSPSSKGRDSSMLPTPPAPPAQQSSSSNNKHVMTSSLATSVCSPCYGMHNGAALQAPCRRLQRSIRGQEHHQHVEDMLPLAEHIQQALRRVQHASSTTHTGSTSCASVHVTCWCWGPWCRF
jgi:hypothetical protein